ncbi:OmpA family protein [Aeromonas caviae]|uniref:OmpA family protein n=1 Tax=Aeromonas caviae TaxID=648 RepID=UPI001F4F0FA9|nr:OmpA family protein [Aeromonas caviae]
MPNPQPQTPRISAVSSSSATVTPPALQKLNLRLSEQRARAVGKVLVASGIPASSIYYQGAGSSRPIADNSDPLLRGQNRRVEIVELANEQALVMRAQSEENNTRYLALRGFRYRQTACGCDQTGGSVRKRFKQGGGHVANRPSSTAAKQSASNTSTTKALPDAKAAVDFGASLPHLSVEHGSEHQTQGEWFALISSAYASDMPMSSCEADKPRSAGQVLSMADDKPLPPHATRSTCPAITIASGQYRQRPPGDCLLRFPSCVTTPRSIVNRSCNRSGLQILESEEAPDPQGGGQHL